jgi:hypothetical protein
VASFFRFTLLLKDQASSEQEKAVGALRQEVERVNEELQKEKSRSEAYKSKALEVEWRFLMNLAPPSRYIINDADIP